MSPLPRLQLLRRAYDKACEALEYQRDETREISAAEALRQYRELTDDYQQQKQHLELSGFLRSNGLDTIIAPKAPESKVFRTPPTTLNDVTALVCEGIAQSMRKAS